ncbi:MAG TPA: hypothetical protein PKV72_01050, partial [Candidatus Peribacteria bacterium]|nr:hypothetical protein [Candidatus Peribacteria bacterium]
YMVPLAQKAEKGALDAEVAKKLREAIGALVQKWRDDNKDVKQLPPELIGLDIQSLEETDGMNLQALLTQASAAVHSYERVKTRPLGFRRFGKLEKRLPGGGPPPFLFCREDNAMHLPLLDAVGSEYKYENLLAVFAETATLPDGRKVTLTTCVFGMNRSTSNLTIYQCVNFDGDRKLGVPVISNPAVFQGTQKGGKEMLDMMMLALSTDPKARERFASARNAPPGAENAPKLADEDGPPIDGKEKPAEGGADGAVGKKTVTETTVKKIPGENPKDPVLLGKEEKITEETAKEKKITTRTPRRTKNNKIIYSEKVEVIKPDGTVEREYKEFQRTVAEGPNKGKWWFIVKTTIQKPGKAEETVKSANVFEDPEKGEDKAIDPESEDGKLLNAKVKTTTVVKDIGGGKTGVEKRTVIEKAGVRTVTVEKPKLLAGEVVYDTTVVETKGDTQTVTEVTKLTADGKVTREKKTVTKGDQMISQTKKMEDGSVHEKTLLQKESKDAKKDVYSETIKFQRGEQVVTITITPTVEKGEVKIETSTQMEKGRLVGSPLPPAPEDIVNDSTPKAVPPVEGKEKASLVDKAAIEKRAANYQKLLDQIKDLPEPRRAELKNRFWGETGSNTMSAAVYTEGDTTWLIMRRDPTGVRSNLQQRMYTDKAFGGRVLNVKPDDVTGFMTDYMQNFMSLDELQYPVGKEQTKASASTYTTNIFAYYTWKPGQEAKPADGETDKYDWYRPLEQKNLRNLADLKALKTGKPQEYRMARYALTATSKEPKQTLADMLNLCDFDIMKADEKGPREPRGVTTSKKQVFHKLKDSVTSTESLSKLLDVLEAEDGYITAGRVDAIVKAVQK